jgi:hypothetical protein
LDETRWVSCLRENLTSSSYGEGLETGRKSSIPRQSLTRQETFRFVKQSYNLEDIRVLSYQRLRNLVLLVTAAAYFAATFLGQKLKLKILCEKLLIISQRFFGIPPFRFYALADGIRKILSRCSPSAPAETPQELQLELMLGWET